MSCCCDCLCVCLCPCIFLCRKKRKQFVPKKLPEPREILDDTPLRYNHPPSVSAVPITKQDSSYSSSPLDVYETLEGAQELAGFVPEVEKSVLYANKNVWLNPYNNEEFVTYLHQQLRGRNVGLVKEFESLGVLKFRFASDEAKSMSNRKKNTNANFIPYDMSRVILTRENAYINASIIPGYCREGLKYIVAQQPIVTAQGSTLGDFWEMVWGENIRCIVSLTADGESEKGIYWPKERSSDMVFASLVNVKLTAKTSYELSTHRTFIVSLEENRRKSFLLNQIEVNSNIIEQKPPCIYPIILSLVQQINEVMSNKEKDAKLCFVSKNTNSIIGILITVFEIMKAIEDKSPFSVFETMNSLLDHRSGMITEYGHYKLIFISILEQLQALQPISLKDLEQLDVGEIDPESETTNSITVEYEKVDFFCNKAYFIKPQTIANSAANKGQKTNISPYDENLVPITDSPTGSNYINASYIHMECGSAPIIAAVHPVKGTIKEFFWMLLTSEVELVFVLAKQQEIDLMADGVIKSISYWSPSVFEKSFGNFNVIGSKPVEMKGMLKYDVRVTYDEAKKEKVLHQFQVFVYNDWDENDLPIDNKKCFEVLEFIQNFRTGSGGDKPVLIQSIDGSTKIGIMLAAMNGRSQIQRGEELDVPWVVKNLRNQRMKMISCREEYQKCYQLLKEIAVLNPTPPPDKN